MDWQFSNRNLHFSQVETWGFWRLETVECWDWCAAREPWNTADNPMTVSLEIRTCSGKTSTIHYNNTDNTTTTTTTTSNNNNNWEKPLPNYSVLTDWRTAISTTCLDMEFFMRIPPPPLSGPFCLTHSVLSFNSLCSKVKLWDFKGF